MRLFCFFFLISLLTQSQITGNLKNHRGKELSLIGFDNFKREQLSVTKIDSVGDFTLIYPIEYKGIAILRAENSSLMFVLNKPNLKIVGTDLKEKDSLFFINSNENIFFSKYIKDYSQRRNMMFSWYSLKNKYETEKLFNQQKKVLNYIKEELSRIEKEDVTFINTVDKDTYVSWFLYLYKRISKIPLLKYNKEQISKEIHQFRSIDFNNSKLKTSGLLKDLIDSHYILLENIYQDKEALFNEINKSTDYILNSLQRNDVAFNIVSDYLFNYLEKRNLNKSSQYLAVKLLSENGCNLNDELTNKLALYSALKRGNIAPDIVFSDTRKLSDILVTKLLVFGASWCAKCKQDLAGLKKFYNTQEGEKIEVVYISLDTDVAGFKKIKEHTSWKTDCKFQGWETKEVKDYHIFATPTYFLLDKNLKILLRPKSIKELMNWQNLKKS